MDEIQSCLDVLRENDVDVDTAVDRLMGNDNLYLEFIKRLPEELNLATLRDALALPSNWGSQRTPRPRMPA